MENTERDWTLYYDPDIPEEVKVMENFLRSGFGTSIVKRKGKTTIRKRKTKKGNRFIVRRHSPMLVSPTGKKVWKGSCSVNMVLLNGRP